MLKPHVSEIVELLYDSTWWTDEGRDRGSRVHGACASYVLATWSPRLPEEEQGYFDSFKRWADRFLKNVTPYSVEKRLEDPLGYCGTPDYCGPFLALGTVIDWKTATSKYPAWKVAGAAYFHLAKSNGFPVERVGNLQLQVDGKMPRMEWISEPERLYFSIFVSLLNIWKFKARFK